MPHFRSSQSASGLCRVSLSATRYWGTRPSSVLPRNGFEVGSIVSQFRKFHGEASDTHDLVLWHEFEESNPHVFGGMYQFWCQKALP